MAAHGKRGCVLLETFFTIYFPLSLFHFLFFFFSFFLFFFLSLAILIFIFTVDNLVYFSFFSVFFGFFSVFLRFFCIDEWMKVWFSVSHSISHSPFGNRSKRKTINFFSKCCLDLAMPLFGFEKKSE